MENKKNELKRSIVSIAQKKLKIKRSFILHRNIFILVCPLVLLVLFFAGIEDGDFLENIYGGLALTLGWGIGVGIHFLTTINKLKLMDEDALSSEVNDLIEKTDSLLLDASSEHSQSSEVLQSYLNQIKREKSPAGFDESRQEKNNKNIEN